MSDENFDSTSSIVRSISEKFHNSNLQLAVRKGETYFTSTPQAPADAIDVVPTVHPDIGCIQTIFEGLVTYYLTYTGRIDPDAPLSEYFPEFTAPGHVGRDIKVIHLMSHSTGFHAPFSFFQGAGFQSWNELTDFFATTQASFPPGSVSSVNSLSRNLLHGLLERVVGKTVYSLVSEYIIQPNNLSANYLNVETGWPKMLFSAEDLAILPNIRLGDLHLGETLIEVLESRTLDVVKGVRAPKAATPVGYSWGVALFSDGTWGLNSNMVPNTAGFRFSGKENFSVALAMDGNHLARDLVMQYLTTSLREHVLPASPGLMGSLVNCRTYEISGIYVADTPDVVTVAAVDGRINIAITKDRSALVDLVLTVSEDGRLYGTGRWDTLQIEFFKNPDTGNVSLLMGQIAYIKVRAV